MSSNPNVREARGTMAPHRYGTFSHPSETVVLLQPINNYSPRRSRRGCGCCFCLCTVILFLILVAWLVLSLFARQPFSCLHLPPTPIPPQRYVPRDWSAFRNQSWAVGFDLTAGYGYVSPFKVIFYGELRKWWRGVSSN
jgi:hypothetical protein